MALHERLIVELRSHVDRLLNRVDQLQLLLDQNFGASNGGDQPGFVSRELRAAAAVGSIAELEALTRSTIQRTHIELNTCGLMLCDISPSMRQLAVHGTFESLRDAMDHGKLWEKRRFATTLETCNQSLLLPIVLQRAPQPPLDGRTLTPKHYHRLWQIYGLPGDPFPVVSWEGSLQKLALLRNDIAHGSLPVDEIFTQAGRSAPEVRSYINDIGLFSINFADRWENYLTNQGYLTR
ncbi:MAG: hypothetical protein ACRDRU_15880 [Pseudonocardiaceae bacterium]